MIETPRYVKTLPLSGKEFSFRPYFVGEEIGFLTAAEMKDNENIVEALFDIVKTCTSEDFMEDISLVDFYFALLNIKSKSHEETVGIEKKCLLCQHTEPITINVLDSIFIDNIKTKSKIVSINDKVKLELKPIKADYLKRIEKIKTKGELIFSSLHNSISKVIIGTEVYNEFTEQELYNNVLTKITKTQLKKVVDAVNSLPMIKIKIVSTCSKCGKSSEYIVDDIFDFLN